MDIRNLRELAQLKPIHCLVVVTMNKFSKKCFESVLHFHLETTFVQLVITQLRLVHLMAVVCIRATLRIIYSGARGG